jgi:hypothetical protein
VRESDLQHRLGHAERFIDVGASHDSIHRVIHLVHGLEFGVWGLGFEFGIWGNEREGGVRDLGFGV